MAGVAYLDFLSADDDLETGIEGDLVGFKMRHASWYRRKFREAGLVECGLGFWAASDLAPRLTALERAPGPKSAALTYVLLAPKLAAPWRKGLRPATSSALTADAACIPTPGARKEKARLRAFERPPVPAKRARPYAELRVASAFSFLNGSSLPEDLVATCGGARPPRDGARGHERRLRRPALLEGGEGGGGESARRGGGRHRSASGSHRGSYEEEDFFEG